MTTKTTLTSGDLRPPVVAVLGHVDHGKTTLLDTIRKTHVASQETGGITQKIGAYQIVVPNPLPTPTLKRTGPPASAGLKALRAGKSQIQKELRKITFIDTPGHEVFTKMRARGIQVADIALLVVAANDGVMPQTVESISHIKNAGIPYLVVLNKIDLPDADPDKIKGQLAKQGVLIEGYGGDVVLLPVSAKTGKGISELLDMILLIAELNGIKGNPDGELSGAVIEVNLDRKKGILATVVVKNGTLRKGEVIYAEDVKAKVRALSTAEGISVNQALPSTPVEVMGWDKLPAIGAIVTRTPKTNPEIVLTLQPKPLNLTQLPEYKKLKVILKTDMEGSLEAIRAKLGNSVDWISFSSGEINESDVLLAKSTGALIIGFNLGLLPTVKKLADTEKVKVKIYRIIYELLTEIGDVVDLLQSPQSQEEILGRAEILAEFQFKDAKIAGCRVIEGRLVRGDLVKLKRNNELLGQTRIKSLRHLKTEIDKADKGHECGVLFDKQLDFRQGDFIISYKVHELLT